MAKNIYFFPFLMSACVDTCGGYLLAQDCVEMLTLDCCLHSMDTNIKRSHLAIPKGVEVNETDVYKKRLGLIKNDCSLYVCGHTNAGSSTIASPDDPKISLTVTQLCEYLSHLPTAWSGNLIVNGCESATSGTVWCCFRTDSIAKRILNKLRITHKHLSVFGYNTSINAKLLLKGGVYMKLTENNEDAATALCEII